MTVLNKDLVLLATLAVSYIAENTQDLSDEAVATMKNIVFRLSADHFTFEDNATDNQIIDLFAEAFDNLVEITETYNDLEYEYNWKGEPVATI